jgi:hypothetical protein
MAPSKRRPHNKNKEVRRRFFNIPNIDAFINRRTAAYIGKVTRSGDDTFPKKFLAARINKRKKNGAPQLTCNNNYAKTMLLRECQPLSSRQAPLKEWLPIAKEESLWKSKIDVYFEACRTIESDDEDENSTCSDNDDKEKPKVDESLNSYPHREIREGEECR